VVLVEVKTRFVAKGYGSALVAPEAAVDEEKLKRLRKILRHLVRVNRWQDRPRRIDVVAVEWVEGEGARVRHHVGTAVGGG
jgi:Holliday junction resolvase-like predicted endonuclease